MSLPWKNLNAIGDLDAIRNASYQNAVVIFKHSTQCAISSMVKDRLEKGYEPIATETYYYLDLLKYRDISNAIAEQFKVHHESPQIILLKEGEVVYDESHMQIYFSDLKEQIVADKKF